jgi:carboxyl-terminal processing protease
MPRSVSFALLLAVFTGCTSPSSVSDPRSKPTSSSVPTVPAVNDGLSELPPDPREKALAEMVATLLVEKHVLRRPLDDKLSKESFPKYIEDLDGAKLLLLEANVTALSKYQGLMDDEIKDRDLVLARKGSALVANRRKVVQKLIAELLSKPFDFNKVEEMETDAKKLGFCKTEAELRERWRQNLQLQALERIQQMEDLLENKGKTSAKDKKPDPEAEKLLGQIPVTPEAREEKARKEIATRFETRFVRLATLDPLEPAESFLNAIAAAYDPHTQYLAPADKENLDIALSGTLEGIGAVLGEKDHYIVVEELVPGGASWRDGRLGAGDLIIAVAQQGKAQVDVTDMPIDKVVKMIRGPRGTVVILTVKKPEGEIQTISITRDVVQVEATYARGAVLNVGKTAVGYVHLPGFYGDVGNGPPRPGDRNATDDVRALLDEFQKRKLGGMIIDLRGNGGGFLTQARDISGLFLKHGPVVQTRDSAGKVTVLSDRDEAVSFDGNVVVMVDRFSASAAEILAACLQDYERAVVIGTGTHGKGTVQAVIELDRLLEQPGKDSLGVFKLTIEQYFRVNGGGVQWKGVTPDISLPDPASFIESGERTLFHSIPWTSVEALPFTKVPHPWALADLDKASKERVKKNALFTKIETFGKMVKARNDDTKESLDKKTWSAKRKASKDALEAADPKLKDQKALFTLTAIGEKTPPPDPAADKKGNKKKLDSWKDELVRDPWVFESLHVLGDMAKKPTR